MIMLDSDRPAVVLLALAGALTLAGVVARGLPAVHRRRPPAQQLAVCVGLWAALARLAFPRLVEVRITAPLVDIDPPHIAAPAREVSVPRRLYYPVLRNPVRLGAYGATAYGRDIIPPGPP